MTRKEFSPTSFPGPECIQRTQLSNGASVLCMENQNSAAVSIIGLIKASSRTETKGKTGLADFTASMLNRGSETRNFQQIHDQLESCGASLNFNASAQNTWFAGKCLAEDLPMLLEISADCLIQPTFPPEYFDRMRSQILSALAIREQDTADRASLALDKILFPNSPLGQPSEGFPETIQSIHRQDLINFHQRFFGSDGMILVVVGGIPPIKAADLVARSFQKWVSAEEITPALPTVTTLGRTVRQHIEIPGKNQMDILLGSFGPARTSPHFLPAYLGNDILGQFGMLGRIGESVRIKAGMAYYAGSGLNSWREGGDWEFMAGVNPVNAEKAIELIIKEIRRFIQKPVSRQELNDSKSHLSGRLALSLESNAGLANAILAMEHFQLGLDYYQHYSQLLEAVSEDQILVTAQQYLDADKLAIVSAGTMQEK
jgi:zinc protease